MKNLPLLQNCHDCGVQPGQPHKQGCDTERCSVCGGQRIQCACRFHDPLFARWTGFFPGDAEAHRIGINLNKFHELGYHKIFFIKPEEQLNAYHPNSKSHERQLRIAQASSDFLKHLADETAKKSHISIVSVHKTGIRIYKKNYFHYDLKKHIGKEVKILFTPGEKYIGVFTLNGKLICQAELSRAIYPKIKKAIKRNPGLK